MDCRSSCSSRISAGASLHFVKGVLLYMFYLANCANKPISPACVQADAGINHKQYGVTSEGVNVFLKVCFAPLPPLFFDTLFTILVINPWCFFFCFKTSRLHLKRVVWSLKNDRLRSKLQAGLMETLLAICCASFVAITAICVAVRFSPLFF